MDSFIPCAHLHPKTSLFFFFLLRGGKLRGKIDDWTPPFSPFYFYVPEEKLVCVSYRALLPFISSSSFDIFINTDLKWIERTLDFFKHVNSWPIVESAFLPLAVKVDRFLFFGRKEFFSFWFTTLWADGCDDLGINKKKEGKDLTSSFRNKKMWCL